MNHTPVDPLGSQRSAEAVSRAVPANVSHETLEALHRLESLLEQYLRIKMRVAPLSAWQVFSSMPSEAQEKIVSGWNTQADFIEGALRENVGVCDEIGMLKYAMGRLGFMSDMGMFADISPDDVVEIYGPDYVQVYRSYNYFTYCNYSLVELAAYPWYELYERSSTIIKQLLEMTESILQGKVSRIPLDNFPEYFVKETMSKEGSVFCLREKVALRLVSIATGQSYLVSVKKIREVTSDGGDTSNVTFI